VIISHEDIKGLKRKDLYNFAQRAYDGNYAIYRRRWTEMPDNKRFCWSYWETVAVVENEHAAIKVVKGYTSHRVEGKK
jgi:hypothetical protein